MSLTPHGRTLAELRQRGLRAASVEYRSAFGRTHDLFNFIDILALDTAEQTFVAIQATSRENMRARYKKIRDECAGAAADWIRCGGRIEIWGWTGADRKRVKELQIDVITMADL